MVDTHAHLCMKDFDADRENIVKDFEKNRLKCVLEVGYDLKSSEKAVEFSKTHDRVYASVGVHPHDAKNVTSDWIEKLKTLTSFEKVIAIGEVGLDYYRNLSPQEKQKDVFEVQLELASSLNLPVILHIRDAYKDAIEILKTHNVKGVVHSFNGDEFDAKEFLNMGLYIGVGGISTYKKNSHLRDIVSKIPVERILTETDSPYLSPQAVRGKRNEPKHVRFVLEMLSELFCLDFPLLEKITERNAGKLFGCKLN